MPDAAQYSLFVGACLALLLAPGPAVIFIVERAIHQGRSAALGSMIGVELASLTHVAAAVVGLSAVLAASAEAYTIIRLAGGAYLIWLGIRTFRSKGALVVGEQVVLPRLTAIRHGYVVNLLNPKTALFFLAFLPQFTDPARGPVALQVLILGLTWVALACLTDGMYAVLAARVGAWLRRSPTAWRVQRWFSSGTYLTLGTVTIANGDPPGRR
jgi:threonine/homoserine/homoserine lactone efflux protein